MNKKIKFSILLICTIFFIGLVYLLTNYHNKEEKVRYKKDIKLAKATIYNKKLGSSRSNIKSISKKNINKNVEVNNDIKLKDFKSKINWLYNMAYYAMNDCEDLVDDMLDDVIEMEVSDFFKDVLFMSEIKNKFSDANTFPIEVLNFVRELALNPLAKELDPEWVEEVVSELRGCRPVKQAIFIDNLTQGIKSKDLHAAYKESIFWQVTGHLIKSLDRSPTIATYVMTLSQVERFIDEFDLDESYSGEVLKIQSDLQRDQANLIDFAISNENENKNLIISLIKKEYQLTTKYKAKIFDLIMGLRSEKEIILSR